MAMELQDLVKFRDNLQQPSNTGLQNLDLLNKLTFQSMGSQEYMNQPMMNTGLMSMPVAQAGFGGFIKSITRIPRTIAKTVKRVAKSPLGKLAITAAPAIFGAGLPMVFANPALNAAFYSGTTSLLTGAKPKDALKSAVLSGGLTGLTRGFTTPKPDIRSLTPGSPEFQKALQSAAEESARSLTPVPETLGGRIRESLFTDIDRPGTLVGREVINPVTELFKKGTAEAQAEEVLTGIENQRYQDFTKSDPTNIVNQTYQPKIAEAVTQTADKGLSLDSITGALRKGVDFAKDNKLLTGGALLGGLALLSGEEIPQDQLNMAGITKETIGDDFDKQRFVYKDDKGNPLTTAQALQMIQTASQSFGEGGQRMASGVRGTFERVDPVLSASGGLIGMAYGGSMPMNNMDVKYKEFSGMVGGRGSGMEDNVYMPIVEGEQGQQVATLAVSPKEYVVDANTMSLLGNGNKDEGAEIMDKTVKDIRMAATGQTKQQKEIDGLAALNRMRRSV